MEQSYKEKYEDVLARLERAKNDNDVCDERFCCVIDDLIPELAESEDEKIKHEIKVVLANTDFSESALEYTFADMIAWLEKQGQVKESHIFQHEIETCKENNNSLTSEDEKVRKALLEMVHDTTGDELWVDYGVHKEEALAWLEKQGEQIDIANKEYWRGYREVRKLILDKYAEVKKQSEQKFEMKTAEESLGVDSGTYNKIIDECIFGEQKTKENKGNIGGISPNSAWSEEDEEVLDALIRRLKGEDIHVSPHLAVECLKSLKERIGGKI